MVQSDDNNKFVISGNQLSAAQAFTSLVNRITLLGSLISRENTMIRNFHYPCARPGLDPDGDGLTNQQEGWSVLRHDHLDSDGDGFSDSRENYCRHQPLDVADFPNSPPKDLNSTHDLLTGQKTSQRTWVGEFNATDADEMRPFLITWSAGRGIQIMSSLCSMEMAP